MDLMVAGWSISASDVPFLQDKLAPKPGIPLLFLLFACQCGPKLSLDATLDENIGTVIHVSWTNPSPVASYIRFGTEDNLNHRTGTLADDASTANLIGMPTDTEVFFELVQADNDKVLGDGSIRTGTLPADYTPYSVENPGKASAWNGYVVTESLGSVTGPIILDEAGNIVWWWQDSPDLITTAALISADRQSIWYITNPQTTVVETGELVRVALDGSGEERFEIPGVHHDFVEMPDGTMTLLSQDTRQKDDVADAVGDRLLNVAADGTYTEVWNIFDDWSEISWDITRDPKSPNWSHANVLHYSEADDAYYMSFRNFESIVKIDRESRTTQWVLGGELTDFSFVGDEEGQFQKQHGFELLPDGILIFDDGDAKRGWSRGVEYTLDFNAMTATLRWITVRSQMCNPWSLEM